MDINCRSLCLTCFLLLVLFGVGGCADLPYDCKRIKNRLPPKNSQAKCSDCIDGYSEDIYDEAEQPKCIPNAKPVHFECRCNEKLLSCPKYLEGDANMSWAVDCVVEGVYPMPNILFLIKNELLLVPAVINVTSTCEHSPDGHSSLTVHCQLNSEDVKRIQQKLPEVDLIFEVRHSFGSHSELVTRLQPQQPPQNQCTDDCAGYLVAFYVLLAFVVGCALRKLIIYYRRRGTGGGATINNNSLVLETTRQQLQNVMNRCRRSSKIVP